MNTVVTAEMTQKFNLRVKFSKISGDQKGIIIIIAIKLL